MQETNDVRLIVEIHNKRPLELLDLTKSLVSVASQFENFVSKNGDNKERIWFDPIIVQWW